MLIAYYLGFINRKQKYFEEKTKETLKSKQTSIATVRYPILTVACFPTPLLFHYPLPLTLFHLLPLTFYCVGGYWDRTQECCDFSIDRKTRFSLHVCFTVSMQVVLWQQQVQHQEMRPETVEQVYVKKTKLYCCPLNWLHATSSLLLCPNLLIIVSHCCCFSWRAGGGRLPCS